MTERNRSRLRQFDSPEAVLALLRLPRKLMKAVDAVDDGSLAMAQRAMFAMALEMFIVAPMRMNNLSGITIDGHLIRSTMGRHSAMHVVVPADEMKNGEPMELALPADTAAMLSTFLKRYHPRLSPEPSIWLFPTSKGTRRSNTPFSRALSLLIKRETGIVMHMHLFRHLAIKLHLSSNPDDIETGRRLLGHKNSTTTTRFYADFKTDSAFKRFDELIASLRDLPSMPPPRAGK